MWRHNAAQSFPLSLSKLLCNSGKDVCIAPTVPELASSQRRFDKETENGEDGDVYHEPDTVLDALVHYLASFS